MSGPEHAERAYVLWSRAHGGLDPRTSAWVSGWVRLTHACARPLTRRGVPADAVTLAGVVVTVPVPLVCALGAGWPLAAVLLVVAGAVLDGVDGAVAAQTGTASAWGKVIDALADRCCDLLLVAALVVLGVPWWLGVALGALTLLLESVRATAQAAGMRDAGVVTVWERPSRVIVTSFAAGLGGIEWLAREAGVTVLEALDAEAVAVICAAIGLVLAVVAFVQLLPAVRRALRRR